MRTPLKIVKGLGTAHNGTHHWWLQRLTAVAMLPLFAWFVIIVLQSSGSIGFNDFFQSPLKSILLALLLNIILFHSALGLRVVIEDYVHGEKAKIISLTIINFFTIITAITATIAILSQYLKFYLG
jgi:succinate dehydrogenase / fumarate reductase membrane anchor subunit